MLVTAKQLRNIAIIAHVDHGKTTLVDGLLSQSGSLGARFGPVQRVMDSNDIEKERGITILSKNTALQWNDYRINIVDTPGHADFGGEVERVLSMVDCALLLVDAVDGPMPQTRFVTQKAFAHGLAPILVVNKIDRDSARPDWVVDQVFDLFDQLGASDDQLDFPVVYASAIQGYATFNHQQPSADLTPLFETIIAHCQPPTAENGPLQMQISTLDYNTYVGALCIGRISRGIVRQNSPITVIEPDGSQRKARISMLYGYKGLERIEIQAAAAGDIVAVAGIPSPQVAATICDPDALEALPTFDIDQPTIAMTVGINSSPFAGNEGKLVTSQKIGARLAQEQIHNVALRVTPTNDADSFHVAGRGELHLSILLETMRREGFELGVSRTLVIDKTIDGTLHEPFEMLTIDCETAHQGAVMQAIGTRKGELLDMLPDSAGRVRLDYKIPSRGLIGFNSTFKGITAGTGLLYHVFDAYAPKISGELNQRSRGAMIANASGKVLGYALANLQERGELCVKPGDMVYAGQIVGIHSRENDLTVNPLKGKQLTNFRVSGNDENIMLTPPLQLTLESALEMIDDDELVEITPQSIRIRKVHLHENARKQAGRSQQTRQHKL